MYIVAIAIYIGTNTIKTLGLT